MARGKWLSEEEKAEITRMRAGGMTTAQIASQMQRGLKTIQRVLNGKHSSGLDAELASPIGSAVSSVHHVSREEAPIVAAPRVATSTVPPDVPTNTPVRNTSSVEANARLQQRPVQKIKPPTRPKKLPRQAPVLPLTAASMPAKQSSQPQQAVAPSASASAQDGRERNVTGIQQANTIAQDDRERSFTGIQQANTLYQDSGEHNFTGIQPLASTAAVLEPSSTVPMPGRAGRDQVKVYAARRPMLPTQHTQPRRQSRTPNAIPRTTHHPSFQDVPFVIPDDRLPVQQEHTLEDEIESMANVVSDDESEDDACEPRQGQALFTPHSTGQANEATMSWSSDCRPAQPILQNEAERVQQPMISAMSPPRSFDSQLRSSQASSWSTSTSQIEPEPLVTKKRKVDTLTPAQGDHDPIEHALTAFDDIINNSATKPDIHGQRLALLFHRFQADVRLVQLERKLDQTSSTAATFSF